MRRLLPIAVALACLYAGCGASQNAAKPKAATTPSPKGCVPPPGHGVMGVCVPVRKGLLTLAPPKAGQTLIPDVSEFQGCGLHSEAIYRVYEAGTNLQDSRAACHAAELRRLHAWAAAYAFLRSNHSCTYEAERTVAIVNSLGGAEVIVADSEVGLRGGFTACFLRTVEQHGYPAVEYTCPGCGDEQVPPVWIASYPVRPEGRWVAHQFSDDWECRGIVGDCSINEGILSIRRVSRPGLEAQLHAHETELHRLRLQLAHLRTKLNRDGCARRVREHQALGPRCRGWYAAGARVSAHGRYEDAQIAQLRSALG